MLCLTGAIPTAMHEFVVPRSMPATYSLPACKLLDIFPVNTKSHSLQEDEGLLDPLKCWQPWFWRAWLYELQFRAANEQLSLAINWNSSRDTAWLKLSCLAFAIRKASVRKTQKGQLTLKAKSHEIRR